MSIFNIISLAGGLALFLYGMSMMGGGLEKVSGGRMESILKRLTGNIFSAVFLGVLVTAAVQSSSATTVIIVGLVNAGILKLRGAIGIIMGANIGTTVTGQILRLADLENDPNANIILKFLKPSTLSAIMVVIGIAIFFISKSDKKKIVGEILLGFGILFYGLLSMESSVAPLQDVPEFKMIFAQLQNPIIGVIAGALITFLIQSSSASIGILQALSSTGAITFSAAFPIIMGQNIGTCTTPMIASINANKNAKRAAMIHFYFNLIGTIIFLAAVYLIQHFVGFSFWDDPIDKGGIANFHTVFNLTVTAILIPFASLLEKLAVWTIRDKKDGQFEISEENLLDERFLLSPALAIKQSHETILQMAKYCLLNYRESRSQLIKYDNKTQERIQEHENLIDNLEDRLRHYLIKLNEKDLTDTENHKVTSLIQIMSEYERIGDYCINITESASGLHKKQFSFTDVAQKELNILMDAVDEIIEMSITAMSHHDLTTLNSIEPLEQVIDVIEHTIKARHIQRFKAGECMVETGIYFVDTLTNLERIADHCSNVATFLVSNKTTNFMLNRHQYLANLHKGEDEEYRAISERYAQKYKI